MTITSTQTMHQARNITVGRYHDDGTVAAFKITCGFKPRYVRIQNLDGSGGVTVEYFEGMDDDTGWLTAIEGDGSLMASNGITVAEDGFTVGLNTDLVFTDEQLSWIAFG